MLQVGWGFTDATPFSQQPDLTITPQQKRDHLYSFWQQHIGRPMALVGGSLGGAIAMDFALAYPEAVEKLVLIDAQVGVLRMDILYQNCKDSHTTMQGALLGVCGRKGCETGGVLMRMVCCGGITCCRNIISCLREALALIRPCKGQIDLLRHSPRLLLSCQPVTKGT